MEYQKYLLGNFGDNSWLLWEGIRLKYGLYNQSYFGLYGYINNSFITEPLTYYPYLFLSRFINAIDLWNAAIVILMFLNIFFSYRYFSKISNYKFVAVVISLVWVSNAYFSIHSRDHLSLMAGFLYPIYMLIYNSKTTFGVFKKYFFLLTSLLISNYIGIFLVFTNLFISLYTYIKEKNKINTLDFLISIFSTLSLSLTLKYFYQYAEKSVENFVIFSFKPWHNAKV